MQRIVDEWRCKPPALVTIALGSNDAAISSGGDKRDAQYDVALDEYLANLQGIVKSFQNAFPNVKILLLTPPPVDDSLTTLRTNANTGRYANVTSFVGSTLKVDVLDLWSSMQGKPDLLRNGFYLSSSGNVFVHDRVLEFIQFYYPDLALSTLPDIFAF
jgi:lysophospholipase L1-like esterase